jgi:hypothetical protein
VSPPARYRTPQSSSADQQAFAPEGEFNQTAWQRNRLMKAIDQLEEGRFAEGERTMSEVERPDLYEPAGYVAKEPLERQDLVAQLAAVVAAT